MALAAAGTTTAAEPSDPRFDPARVEWRVAHLEARKLIQSMDVAIGVDHPEADEVVRIGPGTAASPRRWDGELVEGGDGGFIGG